MLFQSIQPASYNDISKHINYVNDYDTPMANVNAITVTACTLGSIILIALVIYVILLISSSNILKPIIYIIISLLVIFGSFILICTLVFRHNDQKLINYELKHRDPHFRTFTINGKVEDISNGSDRDTQELRFSKNGKNYYTTISSDIPVTISDPITVKIDNQLVDNTMKPRNLSESLNKTNSIVIIEHENQKYKTKLNRTYDYLLSESKKLNDK